MNNMHSEHNKVRPATDILENEDGFTILMDMPGVDKQDLVIDLNNSELTISGKTAYDFSDNEKHLDLEFNNVEFLRSFTLSDVVDGTGIKAGFENGVLKLDLPKREEVKPRRIEISSN